MKPRGKKTSGTCDAFVATSQVNTGGTAPKKKENYKSLSCEGVQCEIGNEVFRKFWTPQNYVEDENEVKEDIPGDPIGSIPLGWDSEDQESELKATSNEGNSTVESTDKVDSSSSTNWTKALSSHQLIVDGNPDHPAITVGGEIPVVPVPDRTLTNNGSTVIFPRVLNVVDGSGTKDVFAIVSLVPMPPSDSSITLTEKENTSSSTIEEIANQSDTYVTRVYTCGDCQKMFSNIVSYEKHCVEHSSGEPFKCTRCTRRFKRRQDLDRHIVCHPEEAFTCGVCFMTFPGREELLFHCKTHESDSSFLKHSEDSEKPDVVYKVGKFQCSQCDKTFSDGDLLQHHEFTHTEGELYPCDQCGRTFREERRLGMHLKLHKKNQRCDKCDEIFTNMFDFNEHMIAHKFEDSKEEYKCVHCKLKFISFYFLKKHVMNHGMEVHWCGDCGGSGHVGLHNQHNVGGTQSTKENSKAQFVQSDTSPEEDDPLKLEDNSPEEDDPLKLEDNSPEEDDPLKLEDNSPDGLISGNIEEQLEIEVQVDDVVIKHENCSSSENEAGVSDVVNTKDKSKSQKRKLNAFLKEETAGRAQSKISPGHRQKSARND